MNTAGRAVIFAGSTVVISLLWHVLLGIRFLYGPAVAASVARAARAARVADAAPGAARIAGQPDRTRIGGWRAGSASRSRRAALVWWTPGVPAAPAVGPAVSSVVILLRSPRRRSDSARQHRRLKRPAHATRRRRAYCSPGLRRRIQRTAGRRREAARRRRHGAALPARLALRRPRRRVRQPGADQSGGQCRDVAVYPRSSPQAAATSDSSLICAKTRSLR